MITRRETTKLLLGTIAAAASLPSLARAARRDDWMAELTERLARLAPAGGGKTLTLVRFEDRASAGEVRMSAVVRMDWTPGVRSRRFEAAAQVERDAFEALVRDIGRGFGLDASDRVA
jgi:hypothetical protein